MDSKKKQKVYNFVRTSFVVLYFILVCYLIYQSSLDGTESSEQSTFVGGALGNLYEGFTGDTIENIQVFLYNVRKIIGHFLAFSLLGILSTFASLMFMHEGKYIFVSIFCNFFQALLIATITETIQLMTPGRSGQVSDIILDYCGFLSSALIITITVFLIIRHREDKRTQTAS